MPIDKACGEGLMPDAVEVLLQLGVDPEGGEIAGIRYEGDGHTVSGSFAEGRRGLGVRRTELSKALFERALELGVEVRTGDGLVDVEQAGALSFVTTSQSGEWRPRAIVGADGSRSLVRKLAGLDQPTLTHRARRCPVRVGIRRHFRGTETQPARDRVEVFWADGVEGYLTPLANGMFGLAFLFSPTKAARQFAVASGASRGTAFEQQLRKFPELRERVAQAEPATSVRGVGPLRVASRALAAGNVALVGDAGGYIDAITGEGMAIAFAEATLLAGELADETQDAASALTRYRRTAQARRRLPNALVEGALVLSRRPGLRRRFLRSLERKPALFDSLLALHARAVPDRAVARIALELGARMALGRRA